MSGDTIVLGSWYNNNVTVYRQSNTGAWQIEANMRGDIGFSKSIAVSEDNLLIGSPDETVTHGAVYYYRRNASNIWTLQDILTYPYGQFGSQVAMSGDVAVIGTVYL